MVMRDKIISEHIFELRYEPFGTLLDIRGTIADEIKKQLDFKHWFITENRIDFRDNEDGGREMAFISFRNLGYVSLRPPTKNYFQDKSARFMKEILKIENFKMNPIHRIGIRSMFVITYGDKFESLKDLFGQKTLSRETDFEKLFEAKIFDNGISMIFRSGDSFFKIVSGPMEKEQMKGFLRIHDDLPEVGLFFDIDNYKKDLGEIDEREISSLIKNFSEKSWLRLESFKTLIFGS